MEVDEDDDDEEEEEEEAARVKDGTRLVRGDDTAVEL